MDKKVIFAVAGSGKTTYIVNNLDYHKRFLIVTFTNNNYNNLQKKILEKFDGTWPGNITLLTYFQFLFQFCYKPFLSDKLKTRGIIYEKNPERFIEQTNKQYYMTSNGYLYSNRIALLIKKHVLNELKERLCKYFDCFIIDEVQDIAGHDFNLLEELITAAIDILFVGDFFQHTFDTSQDGNVNKNLYKDMLKYKKRFESKGITVDTTTLTYSWRCSKNICSFITKNLDIPIYSHRSSNDNTQIELIKDSNKAFSILNNENIIKLHYQNSAKYGRGHKNWGDSKGEDHYIDVCVLLNKTTKRAFNTKSIDTLAPATRNKLYVAITRAHGNCILLMFSRQATLN